MVREAGREFIQDRLTWTAWVKVGIGQACRREIGSSSSGSPSYSSRSVMVTGVVDVGQQYVEYARVLSMTESCSVLIALSSDSETSSGNGVM